MKMDSDDRLFQSEKNSIVGSINLLAGNLLSLFLLCRSFDSKYHLI